MGKHSGGNGNTMKSGGDWKGTGSGDKTTELPKQDKEQQRLQDQVKHGTKKGN